MSYENTKLWENYMFISVDIGDFLQARVAINKLLDLGKNRKKPIDELILDLDVLTSALSCMSKSPETDPNELTIFKKSLLAAFARVSSQRTLNPKVLSPFVDLLVLWFVGAVNFIFAEGSIWNIFWVLKSFWVSMATCSSIVNVWKFSGERTYWAWMLKCIEIKAAPITTILRGEDTYFTTILTIMS